MSSNNERINIPIFLATDDNYAPYAACMMYSVLKNTESNIDFYILDGGITKESKSKIQKTLQNFKHKTIKYFNMTKYNLERFPDVRHYSLNSFSRYFIPDIAPNCHKVLYMDVDIIVKGDIADLYNQDLENYPIGAVLEDFYSGNYTNLKNKIWPEYKGEDKYFNSGVLLLDVKKFIDNKYSDQLVDLTIKLFDKLCCPDQDVFNILFENNFKVLDYKYNYMPDHIQILQEKHPGINVEPIVIHYTSAKPWKAKYNMADEFWKIARCTNFYKQIEQAYPAKSLKNTITYKLFSFIPILKIEEY